MSDVSLIERHIAERFAHWEIRLPQEAVARREPGHIFKGGWHIGFLWGEEEGDEYLEYLSQHRKTDDLHTRVYASGRVDDDLPAPSMLSSPEEIRAIYAELREAGLLPPVGMNQGALEINEFLRSQDEPPGPSQSGTRGAPTEDLSPPGDATVQLEAESIIREEVIEEVGKGLIPAEVAFGAEASVRVDGVAEDGSVFVEIFAHQGKLKGGQRKKVGLDALKLITLGRTHREARLILAFADEAAASYVLGKGWLAEALKAWDVEVLVVELDEIERAKIKAAQAVQEMRSAGDVD